MDDQGSSDDGVLAEEADLLVGDVELDGTASIGLDVSEVTYVPLLCVWCTVLAAGRVEVRTGGGASIASITKLVDVEASLSVGVVSSDFARDFDGRVLVCLLELDNSRNLGVTSENGDCGNHG